MRCGCEGPFNEALKRLLPRYKKRFEGAFLANCDVHAYENRHHAFKKEKPQAVESKRKYAIQILSFPLGKGSLLGRLQPKKGCYRVVRESFEAIRCGCFDQYKEAKQAYGTAFITFCDEKAFAQSVQSQDDHVTSVTLDAEAPKPVSQEAVTPSMPKKQKTPSQTVKKDLLDNDLLDRLYESFIYTGDALHALQTAELALRQGKGRRKWLKRAMETAEMVGDEQKVLHYTQAYFHSSHDKSVLNRLIDHAMGNYHYEQALYLLSERYRLGGDEKDIPAIVSLYEKVGEPEKARDLLYKAWKRNPQRRKWLEDALQISLDMGDIDGAKPLVRILQKQGIRNIKEAEQVAYFYFLNRKPQKAFSILTRHNLQPPVIERGGADYYRKISGLGWMLGYYKKAADASYRLIKAGLADKNDYFRVIAVYQNSDKEKAFETALDGLRKWHEKSYFYTAAALAMDMQDDQRMRLVFEALNEPLKKILKDEADYHILLGGYLMRTGRQNEALKELQTAYTLAPESTQVMTALMWFYLDNKMDDPLRRLLQKIEADGADPALYPVLIAAHMRLQQSDRARFYMHRLYKDKTLNGDERANLAYLYQAQMRMALFKKEMGRLFETLSREAKKNPKLLENGEFWDAYLRSAMEFVGARRYRALLKKAKPYLKPDRYKEIVLLWDLRRAEYERAREEYRAWEKIEPWIALSLAMHFGDQDAVERLLYRYDAVLPIRDRVEAARMTGQIAMAQTLAFEGLEANERDYLLYYQREQLLKSESDGLSVGASLSSRDSLARRKVEITNRNALPGGFWLSERLWYAQNDKPGKYIRHMPDSQWGADATITARYDRGKVSATAGARDGMASYATAGVEGEWQVSDRWRLGGGYHFREDTEDTTWLMLGGYANRAEIRADYKWLNSTSVGLRIQRLDYKGQDGEDAGKGWKYGASLFRVWRTGYPDIQFSLYAEKGDFEQNGVAEGVLRSLMVLPASAAPSDYSIVGGGVYVGYLNRNDYVRSWRPFAGVMPYYDYESQTGSAGAEIGVGGSLLQQDHLNISLRYTPALYRGQEDIVTLYMLYRLMY